MNIRATAFCLLLLFVGNKCQTAGQCRPGWAPVNEVLCVTIGSASTWHEAWGFCHVNGGFLAEPGKQYNLRSSSLSDLLSRNGINVTWSGIHVRDGKLLVDGFYSKTAERFSEAWQWAEGEPSLDDTKLCGKVFVPALDFRPKRSLAIKRRQRSYYDWINQQHDDMLMTVRSLKNGDRNRKKKPASVGSRYLEREFHQRRRTPQLPGIIRRIKRVVGDGVQVAMVTMADCKEKLPFVCQSNAMKSTSVSSVSICEQGTFGNYYANRCYSLYKDPATHTVAQERCEKQGKQLSRFTHQMEMSLTTSALQQLWILKEEGRFSAPPVWVETDYGNCSAVVSYMTQEVNTGQPSISWPCDSTLPYLCETPGVWPETKTLKLTHQLSSGRWVSNNPSDTSLHLPPVNSMSRPLTDVNNVTCHADPFVSERQQITWFKDGSALPANYITSIQSNATLHFALGRGINNFVGYYWCEVIDLNTTKIVQSVKFFVRHNDRELFAGMVRTKTRISPQDVAFFNYLGQASKILQSSMQILVEKFNPFTLTPLRYRFKGDVVDFLASRRNMAERGDAFEGEALRIPSNRTALVEKANEELIQDMNNSQSNYIDLSTLQLFDIDICHSTVIVDEIRDITYHVNQTTLGKSFRSKDICLVDGKPYVEMKCVGDHLYGVKWQQAIINTNCNLNQVVDSQVSQSLKNLSKIDITDLNIEEVVRKAKILTDDIELLNEKDIIYSADIVQKTSQLRNISSKTAEEVLDLATNVMRKEKEILHKSENLGRAPSRIIRSLDAIDNIVDMPTSGALRLVTETYGSTIWDLTKYVTNPVIGLQLTGSETDTVLTNDSLVALFDPEDLVFHATEAAIVFPKSFVQEIIQDHGSSDIRLTMHVYKDTRLFTAMENTTGRSSQFVLNSKVISAKLLVDNKPITELNDVRVKTVFFPDKLLKSEVRANLTGCGYWDWKENTGLGGWSLDGCVHVTVDNGRDVCHCDHLTNFAVLLDFYGQNNLIADHQLALSIISIIGLSLSIAGLSLTVLTFLLFKKLRQTRPQQTLFNLALAQLCAWVVFLAGINQTQNEAGCIAVAVMLHYFIVASFMWMLVEAVLHYLLFVKVLGSYVTQYVFKTAIPAWGIPLVPVIVVLSIDYKMYLGGSTYCWMSLRPFYYAFALPIGLIILANLVLYIMVAVSICRRSSVSSKSTQSNTQRHLVSIRASVFCFILLGLSWIFGYLAISEARIVFQYIFTITNTVQGFLIFLLFTARDKKVRESWRALCCPKKKMAASSSTGKPVERVHLTDNTAVLTATSSNSDNHI